MATIHNNVMTFDGRLQLKRGTKAALEASDYVPAAGEILVATDTGEIKAGDGSRTWSNLPSPDTTVIIDNYDEENTGKALDATKGKDLNNRLLAFEGMTGIDCGEITAADHENSGD